MAIKYRDIVCILCCSFRLSLPSVSDYSEIQKVRYNFNNKVNKFTYKYDKQEMKVAADKLDELLQKIVIARQITANAKGDDKRTPEVIDQWKLLPISIKDFESEEFKLFIEELKK